MTTQQPSKAIHISLWIAQVILATLFLMAATMKTTQPIEELSKTIPWTKDVPEALVRFIGTCELLGALGLILPAALRIKPNLTPLAASGLATIQVFAIIYHISKGETEPLGMNVAFALIAIFIAWGRFKKAPIQPKA